jgi:cation-transporting ATPase E
MRNVLFRAFPAGITDFLMICGISFFADLFLVKTGDLSTCCTILLLVVGLMILYRVMAPMNSMHWVIELGMPLCFIFCALVMPELLQLSPLTREGAVLTVLFAVNAEPCLRYLSLLFDYLNGLFHTLWNKLKESDYLMQI